MHPPPMFRRYLQNVAIDGWTLTDEPSTEVEVDAPQTHHQPQLASIFSELISLRSLSIQDVHSLLSDEDVDHLINCTVRRLYALLVGRELGHTTHLLRRLLQPPCDGSPSQLRRLSLLYDRVTRACFSEVLNARLAGPSALQPTYAWPLQHSLTALTITLAHPNALLPLTHIPLEVLDLTIDCNLASLTEQDHHTWKCIYLQRYDDDPNGIGVGAPPVSSSSWCHSLRTLHLTVTNLHDIVVRSISHLTSLTDLAIRNSTFDNDDTEPHQIFDVHQHDWSEVLAQLVEARHSTELELTPAAVYELRHLHKLVRLELELRQGWILPLVPFLSVEAVRASSRDGGQSTSPLSFWSSFPSLFCFKYHSPVYCDLPCLHSLDQLDATAFNRALHSLLPSADTALQQQDLMLYSLAACESLRSLHIRSTECSPQAMHTFVHRSVCDQLQQQQIATRAILPLNVAEPSLPSSSALLSVRPSPISMFDLCFFHIPQSISADLIAGEVAAFAHSLRYLHFIHCTSLGDDGLRHILRSCIHLHTLDVHGCYHLTAAALSEIGERIPLLHSLNLSKLHRATDAVLTRILLHTPNLHSLHLEQTSTTSAVLLPVIMAHVRLLCLNVRQNDNQWTRDDLTAYKVSLPCPMQLLTDWEETGEK
jgi:hypothetical protein